MRLEVIPNKGPASMGPEIQKGLDWAERVDIASAFVGSSALGILETALAKARRGARSLGIRLVTGLYQNFTSPEAIARAMRMQKAFPGSFQLKIARNNRFHWKLYLFGKGRARRLYIGSANFTDEGLKYSGELSVKIGASARDRIARSIHEEFRNLWKHYAFEPRPAFLRKHRKSWHRPKRSGRYQEHLLAMLETPEVAQQPPGNHKLRLVVVSADLADETQRIVREETEWDKKRWDYTGFLRRSERDAARAARIILFMDWRHPPTLEFHQSQETANISTTDGNYFLASSKLPNSQRVKYEGSIANELNRIGLSKRKLKNDRNLNRLQYLECARLMHATTWLSNHGFLPRSVKR